MSSPPPPGQVDPASGATASDQAEAALKVLGSRLRQARESRGLRSADLADRLRIGVEQLEALETADRSRLPEQVFVIAQARRLAGALQIDISAELDALRASPAAASGGGVTRPKTPPRPAPGSSRAPAAPEARGRHASRRSAAAPPVVWAVGGLLLLLAALWGVWQLRGSLQTARRAPQTPAGRLNPAPASPSSSPAGQAPSSSPDAVARTGEPVPPAGSVVLASREPSWVEVRRPDGTIVFRGLLRGSRVFSLEKGLQVLAGRPDLVSTRVGTDPARVLGPISEVRWRSLPAAR